MPFNGAGVFSRTPGTRITTGAALVSAQVNDETDNLVNGINGKVNLDGLLTMTGLQTLFGDGTSLLHGATVQQVQTGAVQVATTVAGTVDAIQVTMTPAKTTWTNKERVIWISAGANTITAPTISKDGGSTTKIIKKAAGVALAVGDLGAAGQVNMGLYNGTDLILMGSITDTSSFATTSSLLGKQTIWVPASAMTPRTTNGAASGTTESTTNKVMSKTLDFDTTTQEFAQFQVKMPKSWDLGTVIAQFVWSHAATTVNFGVVWALEGSARSDNETIDVAFGTAQQVADTGGTTDTVYITAETTAITIGNTPSAQDLITFQVKRVPADGSDTMAIDARLLGVKILYTQNAVTDN